MCHREEHHGLAMSASSALISLQWMALVGSRSFLESRHVGATLRSALTLSAILFSIKPRLCP